MTEEQKALSRRAVACKGWRWMPGMRWWTDDDDRGRLGRADLACDAETERVLVSEARGIERGEHWKETP